MTSEFEIGPWRVLPLENRLRKGETTVPLEPRVMEVLVCLASRKGNVVTREELIEEVWDGVRVTDHVLSRCISELRKALGDDPRHPRFVETLRKRGYRLLPEVYPKPQPPRVPDAPVGEAPPAPPRSGAYRPGLAVGILLFAIVVVMAWNLLRPPTPGAVVESWRDIPLTSRHGSELDPTLAPDGRAMAFSWSGEDGSGFDIYVKELRSETVRRLTDHAGDETNPCWSADGERIAFVRSGAGETGIFVVAAAGGEARAVSPTVSGDICDLLFTNEGRALLLIDRPAPGEPFSAFRIDLLSRQRTRLTHPPAHYFGDRDLAVSPDGSRLAFARAERPGYEDLHVLSLGDDEGAAPEQRLTFDRASISGLEWTADGREILFSSGRDGTPRLWRIDGDGGEPRPVPRAGDHVSDPMLALEEGKLVFERRRFEVNLWRSRRDGARWSEPKPLITSTRWDWKPRFAPDGHRIAFLSDRTGRTEIWLADAEGTNPRPVGVPVTLHELLAFDWAPDGRSLVVEHRDDQRRSDLTLLDLGGGDAVVSSTLLLDHPANDIAPSFARDGRSLLFVSDRSGDWQLWRMDLEGSRVVRVSQDGAVEGAESRDGKSILLRRPHDEGLFVLPTEGSSAAVAATRLPIPGAVDHCIALAGIVALLPGANRSSLSFAFHDLATGTTTDLGVHQPRGQLGGLGLTMAPDGQTLVFARVDRQESDIVMIEGFR